MNGSITSSVLRAEALQHVLNDVVAADQDPVTLDLGFQVPVAQVPGQHAAGDARPARAPP